jgi:hypothetical protein
VAEDNLDPGSAAAARKKRAAAYFMLRDGVEYAELRGWVHQFQVRPVREHGWDGTKREMQNWLITA